MINKIFLSDYCSASITSDSTNSTKPHMSFDFSQKLEERYKVKPNNIAIFSFKVFHSSDVYDEHLKLITNDKIKDLIVLFCNINIEANNEAEYFKVILEECKNSYFRDTLLNLFEKICWKHFN